ncbi:MAG: hypothetical protein AWU58_228 [Methanohalophilus sp. T328-1]|jgi:hypothetical protein|uniref:hypothetical protein n=1 Tax=Methanohalophilus sp. WG1-DM TaxID=2491675 RepID=UPI000792B45F|nr:hypothetical protein [Methanohalophilus sp. WG1-DM]KXS46807.1 MAG: hypothetical protein AWU58_228 [Methanohalophilus sp. T328-1]RXG34242.1 hypothetical protein CI957_1150 [Methanohalophilus sp. WG1-DM]
MALQNMFEDNEFLIGIGKLAIFLIITFIGNQTYVSIKKIDKHEKNKYFEIIKENRCVKYTSLKINALNEHKYFLVSTISLGMLGGILYFFIVLAVFVFIPAFYQFYNLDELLINFKFNINNEQAMVFIIYTLLNITTLPLIVGAKILDYIINIPTKMLIKPNDIKRKRLNKKYQIWKYKIYNLARKLRPRLDNKMQLTKKSTFFITLLPILVGMISSIQYLIYVDIYSNYDIYRPILNNWIIVSVLYLVILVLCIIFSLILIKDFFVFLNEGKNKIIQFYSKGYPHIYIKTPSGELTGKIENVFDKHIIVLNDNGVQKMTSWNNVEIIEINNS